MATIKINDTVFTINEEEAYTVLELLRNVIMPKVEKNTQDITTNTEDINQNKQMLANHSTAITQNATNILKNTNDINQLESELEPIKDNVADLLSDVETLKTETETLGNDINDINNTTIPGMMEEISNTQSTLSDVQSNVSQLEISITNVENQADQLVDDKFDDATITNTNVLNLIANNVIKKSLTLPAGGGGGGSGTTIEHIQVLTSNNEPVNAFMMKNSEYALIFLCDICNFPSTDTFTLPENLRSNYFLSTGNYTNGEGKVMQAGKLKEIYIVVNNSQRSEIKIMGDNAMPVQVGANAFIWAWFMLKLTEG